MGYDDNKAKTDRITEYRELLSIIWMCEKYFDMFLKHGKRAASERARKACEVIIWLGYASPHLSLSQN